MKFVEAMRILNGFDPHGKEPLKIHLASGFTPLYLQTFLVAHLQNALPDRAVQMETGLFGDLAGNVERLSATTPAYGVIAVEWQDLDARLGFRSLGGWLPDQLPEISQAARSVANRLTDAIEACAVKTPLVVYGPTLPLPPVAFHPGTETSGFEAELRSTWTEALNKLAKLPNVRVVSEQRLAHHSPHHLRLDLNSELRSGFPYRVEHASALGEIIAGMVLGATPKKGLITDLDDTMWSGIVGDVGPGNIQWTLDHHAQIHGLYQQMLDSLGAAGVLIAVASKNEREPVQAAFARPDMVFRKERVFPWEVHWGPKSESVQRIMETWNIGADAAVFIDDSPMELEEVKRAHPQVECIAFPKDPNHFPQFLERLRDLFGKSSLQVEDTIRVESIRQAGETRIAQARGGRHVEDFLAGLQAEITLAERKNPNEPRPLELVNKTNQFNLNGRRWDRAEWIEFLGQPDTFLQSVSYKDKFGTLGTIAVLGGRANGKRTHVDFWVISCRAFSRRVEHQCLQRLFTHSPEIEFDFAATPKNRPIQEFFSSLLDREPKGVIRLCREDFVAKCPPLHHEVKEISE